MGYKKLTEKLGNFLLKDQKNENNPPTQINTDTFDNIERNFINVLNDAFQKASYGGKADSSTIALLKLTLDVLKSRKLEYKERTKGYFTPEDYKKILEDIKEEETKK